MANEVNDALEILLYTMIITNYTVPTSRRSSIDELIKQIVSSAMISSDDCR